MAKVIFFYNGNQTTIQCMKEDKMRNICQKFASKINIDINSLYFIYSGNKINYDLSFKNQANSIDNDENKMVILAFQNENEKLICPKCGEKINFDNKLTDKISLSNNDINDILEGIKIQIGNIMNDIINNQSTNYINNQLKNINIIINNTVSEIKKINQLINLNQTNHLIKKSIIEGELDIKVEEIQKGVVLFNKDKIDGIDVYLNNNKINMIKEKNRWIIDYNFKNSGRYKFKIIFNRPINDLIRFFCDCSNLYSIDLSELDSSNISNMRSMFHKCERLREIKGINKLNTSNVHDISRMFQFSEELEYLDLSNFDTSKVIGMGFMFNHCKKLKEIKGLKKFNTCNVCDMRAIFQECNEIKYLDLSNFNTLKVSDMSYMFNRCFNLREIKGLSKFNTSEVILIEKMFNDCQELEYLDLSSFDTSNVVNMEFMFRGCQKLKEIKGINNFKTNKVSNMASMFEQCEELQNLNLSNFDTSNVTDMSWMFIMCRKIKEIKGLNKFNTNKVENMSSMFKLFEITIFRFRKF